MTREEFRNAVFERDGHQCVVCGRKDAPLDAHHIIERRLWPDGGYFPDNGVSLCPDDHMAAEETRYPPYFFWAAIGAKPTLPPHMPADGIYDKWGNEFINNGEFSYWIPGELFEDESVQKVIRWKLDKFRHHRKYPKTPHLPWSPGIAWDDFALAPRFQRYSDVIVTEKMDGENTTLYHDYIHARSLDMSYHQSRTWVKNLHAKIAHEIPDDWRICGENLFAKHAIAYRDLPSYFLVFSIWAGDRCLSWQDTVDYCDVLGLHTVPVLWGPGMWFEDDMPAYLQSNPFSSRYSDEIEGYVIRTAGEFRVKDFQRNIAKWVRPNHVNPDTQNWKAKMVVPNMLRMEPSAAGN